ncbi:SLC13 family permease [Candidatus Neomarinimicrobiota bacterium]
MTLEIAIVLLIIGLAFVLFVTEALPIDVTALSILGIMILIGYISPQDAIKGFSNPAVITIAALFILSFSLQKSGVLEYLVLRLLKIGSKSKVFGLIVYLFAVAIASAFVNNTAIVAVFIPITIRVAQKFDINPSKVLIPLSYAAILGGTLTLVGTSTNLLVNSLLIEMGNYEPLGMFEFTKYSAIQLIIGLTFIILIAYRYLPSRTVPSSLTQSYQMGEYLTEMKISENSPLIGKTCIDRNLNRNFDVTVLDIVRDGKMITMNIRNLILKKDDILFVRGTIDNFLLMKDLERVTLLTDEKLTEKELVQEDNVLVQCLLTDKSDLTGKSLMQINFRRRFGAFVLAIRREGEILRKKIAHITLRTFDTLLIYGSRQNIDRISESDGFIVLDEIDTQLKKHRLWWLGIVVILTVVCLSALSVLPILTGTLIGATILLIFRVLAPNEAYNSIHWHVIVFIAALIPLGQIIQTSGTAEWIGNSIYSLADVFPESYKPLALLSLIYLITIILTEVSSNAATAILMTPIAFVVSAKIGLDPRPFIFAICFAASASFITPIGYQTNLMVYGPGGYKFTDYMKVGFPLALIFWILATLLIPVFWPFQAVG